MLLFMVKGFGLKGARFFWRPGNSSVRFVEKCWKRLWELAVPLCVLIAGARILIALQAAGVEEGVRAAAGEAVEGGLGRNLLRRR
jgi:hypothetical protein